MPRESTPFALKRRSGIRACYEEGFYAQIFITLTSGKFLTDLALHFGAASIHLGLINAIPFLACSAQVLGAYLTTRLGSRRKVLVPSVGISRAIWWVVLALVLLPIPTSAKLWAFVAVYAISSLAGQVSGNAWLSWLSDLIPNRMLGRVISSRNGLLLAIGIFADFLMSTAREHMGDKYRVAYLALVLCIAAFFATKTIFVFFNSWDPPSHPAPMPSPLKILRRSFSLPGMRRLIFALLIWNTAVGVAVAFWAPHMMTYLQMPFTKILIYSSIVTTVSFFMSTFIWGAVIDRAGTLPVVLFCASIIVLFPLFWLFATPQNLTPLWIEGALSGFAWSGFNVGIFNMPFQILPKKNRSYFFAVLSALSGVALGIGSVAGGMAAQVLEPLRITLFGIPYINYHATFVLSFVLRLSCLPLLARIPDTRSRGMVFMFQAMGDGVQKIMTSPRLVLLAYAPRRKRRGRHAASSPATPLPAAPRTGAPHPASPRTGAPHPVAHPPTRPPR